MPKEMYIYYCASLTHRRGQLERQKTKLRVRRYHSLLAAYHVLLDDGSKNMSLQVWIDLVGMLRKDVDESEIR